MPDPLTVTPQFTSKQLAATRFQAANEELKRAREELEEAHQRVLRCQRDYDYAWREVLAEMGIKP